MVTSYPPEEPGAELSLDELDVEIIRHLQEDGRRSYREIGRALQIAEATVRWRVRRLLDARALRIVAIADPFRIGFRVLAFVLIAVEPGRQRDAIRALVAFPEVTYVSACTGRFDIYVQVVCRDHDHLFSLLSERIPEITGVTKTETFTELRWYKISYRYPFAASKS